MELEFAKSNFKNAYDSCRSILILFEVILDITFSYQLAVQIRSLVHLYFGQMMPTCQYFYYNDAKLFLKNSK